MSPNLKMLSPCLSTLLLILPHPFLQCKGTGEWKLQCVHCKLSLSLLSLQGEEFSNFLCSRQFSMNFCNISPSHRLQFFTNFSTVGLFCGITSPGRKSAPAWTPISKGPRVFPRTWSSSGFPQGYSLL